MRSLILLLFIIHAYNSDGQTRFVKGIVIESSSKEPMIFATVYHPETKTYCYTDLYGKFLIELEGSEKTYLFINYTGYECKIQEVGYRDKFVEIKLELGQTIPPLSIIEYKKHNNPNKTPMDSINLLCNKYKYEVDSLLAIKNQIKN